MKHGHRHAHDEHHQHPHDFNWDNDMSPSRTNIRISRIFTTDTLIEMLCREISSWRVLFSGF